MTTPHRPTLRPETIAAWLFPILAVAIATFYLGGALGKNTDDYALNLRDPATGAIPSPFNPWHNYPYFWRPLHNLMLFGTGTLWPGADRSVHLAVAVFHALACLGLFLTLRRLTRTTLAPAAAALVFAVLPLNGEVCFWYCTTSTAIGAALFFAAALLAMRYAARDRHTLRPLAGIFLIAFAIPCFYEQAATPFAALPLFMLAAPRPTALHTLRDRLARITLATFAAGLPCILYIALMQATAPDNARGNTGSFITRATAHERLFQLAQGIRVNLFGERARDVLLGSIKLGWETAATPRGLLLGSLLLASGMLWLVWCTRRGGRPATSTPTPTAPIPRGSPVILFLCGVATFLAAWLPVYVVQRQIVELRMTYIPLLGLGMMLAAVLDALLTAASGLLPRTSRAAIGIVTVALVLPGVLGLIGHQKLFQRRWQLDQETLAQLRNQVPDPPPNTVFVPMHTSDVPCRTGYTLFDRARPGGFETTWSAEQIIRHGYRRADLGSTAFNPWDTLKLDAPTAESVHIPWRIRGPWERTADGGVRIPWASTVPFVINPQGRIRLVRTIQCERADNADLDISPPVVAAALTAHPKAPWINYRLDGESPGPELIPLADWRLADGTPMKFEPMWIWPIRGKPRTAGWLAGGGARASMSTQLPPLDRPERLLMRATIAEYDLDPKRNPTAAVHELIASMGAAPDRPIATLRLDPGVLARTKAWVPFTITVPPRTGEGGDRVIITVRTTADPPVRTDPADASPIPPDARAALLPVWITPGYEQSIVEPTR